MFLQSSDANNLRLRPYLVTFADVPDKEVDGEPFKPFGFDDLTDPTFTVDTRKVFGFSLGGSDYAAFVSNAENPTLFKLYVVDRKTNKTYSIYTLPTSDAAAPIWSPNGKWLVFYKDSSGSLSIINVPARLTELGATN